MPSEFDVIDKKSIVIFCAKCGGANEGMELAVDNRFFSYTCECGKVNLVAKRDMKRRGYDFRLQEV